MTGIPEQLNILEREHFDLMHAAAAVDVIIDVVTEGLTEKGNDVVLTGLTVTHVEALKGARIALRNANMALDDAMTSALNSIRRGGK